MSAEHNPLLDVVKDYSDVQLLEVIQNSKRFSPKLVDAALTKAKERNISLSDQDASNPFTLAAGGYTDAKIIEVVANPHRFAAKLHQACKLEADKRGLSPSADTGSPFTEEQALYQARTMLARNSQVSHITETLVSRGIERERALKIIDQAVRMAPLAEPRKQSTEDSGPSVWTILFIIFIVVRIIIRMARN